METKDIIKSSADISIDQSAMDNKNAFCNVWPNAKTGLELLAQLIKNPALKVVIGTIIAAGDVVAKKICG